MKFTVDRKTWLRGEGTGPSRLLRAEDGKRCCIGFVCQKLGIADDVLRDKAGVVELPKGRNCLRSDDRFTSGWVSEAYAINDERMDDSTREQKLRDLFAANGHEIEFVN